MFNSKYSSFFKFFSLPLAVISAPFLATPTSADIMRSCPDEISTYCSGVPRGRGRIAACLYSHIEHLSGACEADVSDLASSGSVSRFVPKSVMNLQGTEYEQHLRQTCTSDAQRLCPKIATRDERVLACLYARERELSKDCKTTGDRVLKELR